MYSKIRVPLKTTCTDIESSCIFNYPAIDLSIMKSVIYNLLLELVRRIGRLKSFEALEWEISTCGSVPDAH